jgi:hypothetical protein
MDDVAEVPAVAGKPKREKPFSLRMYPYVRELAEHLGKVEAELSPSDREGLAPQSNSGDPLFNCGFDGSMQNFSSMNDAINALAYIGAWKVREWLSADLKHALPVAHEYRMLLKFALDNPDEKEVQTGPIGSGLIAKVSEKVSFKPRTWPVDRKLWMRLAADYEERAEKLKKAITGLDAILEYEEPEKKRDQDGGITGRDFFIINEALGYAIEITGRMTWEKDSSDRDDMKAILAARDSSGIHLDLARRNIDAQLSIIAIDPNLAEKTRQH